MPDSITPFVLQAAYSHYDFKKAATSYGTAFHTSILILGIRIHLSTSFVIGGNVVYRLAVPAMLCSLVGGYVGSAMAVKRGARFIRGMMLAVMALLMVKLAADLFTGA